MKCTVDGNFEAVVRVYLSDVDNAEPTERPDRVEVLLRRVSWSTFPGPLRAEVYQSPWIEHFKLETCPSDHCAEESS